MVHRPYAKRQLFPNEEEQGRMAERGNNGYYVEMPGEDGGEDRNEMTVYQQSQYVKKILIKEMASVSLKSKLEDQNTDNSGEPVVKRRRGLEGHVAPQSLKPGKSRKGPRARIHRAQEEAGSSWEEQTPWQERWKQVLTGDYVFQAGERSDGRPSSTTQEP